jgi:hypothetical protein
MVSDEWRMHTMSWIESNVRPPAALARQGPATDTAGQMTDEYVDTYIAWREQSAELQTAYDRWCADSGNSAAYEIYRAELEFEEQAARTHQETAER